MSPAETPASRPGGKPPGGKTPGGEPWHLFALTSLAVAQPLFDLLARAPGFFVTRNLDAAGVWVYILAVTAGLPAVLIAIAELAGAALGHRARDATYHALLALLVTLTLLVALRRTPSLPAAAVIAPAVVLGALFPLIYVRVKAVGQFLSLLAPLTLAVPLLFAFVSPVRGLLFPPPPPPLPTAGRQVANPVPVVLIVFDELPTLSLLNRDREIDAELYPSFARLAATSTWYRGATSPSPFTLTAVPSILVGHVASDEALPTLEHHPRNLFTLLEGTYEMLAFEPLSGLLPRRWRRSFRDSSPQRWRDLFLDSGVAYLHLVAPAALASRLPPIAMTWDRFSKPTDRAAAVRGFISQIEQSDRPQVIFLHSQLPHHPWVYLPSGKRYDTGREVYIEGLDREDLGSLYSRWSPDPWRVIESYQRHLLQVGFVDRLLGEITAQLRRVDLFDPALVIVTADHGIHFEPGGLVRALDETSREGIGSVPLIVKLPGQTTGAISDRRARVIDILPTIADVVGVTHDWPMEGVSLTTAASVPGPAPAGGLEVKLGIFGEDSQLYRIGPHHEELLGLRLDEVEVIGGRGWKVRIEGLERWENVDLSAPLLPVRVIGQIEPRSEVPSRSALALAVNGSIEALTHSRSRDGDAGAFSFMIPEGSLEPGRNTLELFSVGRRGDHLALGPIEIEASVTYRLIEQATIEASGGDRWTVEAAKLEGEVAGLVFERLGFRMECFGWAREVASGEAAERIVVFSGGRFVAAAGLDFGRSKLRQRYLLPGREGQGFLLYLPIEKVVEPPRFFALSRAGFATELRFSRRDLNSSQYIGPFEL